MAKAIEHGTAQDAHRGGLCPPARRASIRDRRPSLGSTAIGLDKEEPMEILEVDNTAVRRQQIARLEPLAVRAQRTRDSEQPWTA